MTQFTKRKLVIESSIDSSKLIFIPFTQFALLIAFVISISNSSYQF